ncbi:MAG: serine hydrolase [Proteobacteria bacterium]|nr:serine hydrolase [Pseudomonadota bacterium]
MSAPPVHGDCDPRFAAVERAFRENFASEGDRAEVGAAVAVTWKGEPVVDLHGGFADQAKTRPWERDTIVNVFSTTKGMTALCAHRLIESGALDLDAPVADVWPEFAQAGKADIPVRHLLNHRAGLPAVKELLPPEALYDSDAMASALAAQEPWWKPGEKHGYHALTYGWLIGEVVRRDSIARCSVEESFGADAVLQIHTRIGLGFMLSQDRPGAAFGPNPHTFGHPGAGGSVGFADPDAQIGFGYVMNRMGPHILLDPRATALIDALYSSLD